MEETDSNPDEEMLRSRIAEANGFDLYKRYAEPDAASIIGIHPQTLKQARLQGRIQFLRIGARTIGYFGFQIADYLIGSITWVSQSNPPSASVSTGLDKGKAQQSGIGSGTTPTRNPHDAHRLARQTLKKPKSD